MGGGDQMLKSYAILRSLKQNMPAKHEVPEEWVREYHSALDMLEQARDIDLTEFRVGPEFLRRSISSKDRSGVINYRDGLWCQRAVLIHKLDSVLLYFTGIDFEQDKTIGFEPP